MYYVIKVLISALLIVLIGEVAKRSSLLGALLASIPIVSVLAMIWLYIDTGSASKVAKLSVNIFWLVLPSLVLFITLPIFLKWQWSFYLSLFVSISLTLVCYYFMILILEKFGVVI